MSKEETPMLLSLVGVPCEIPFKTKDAPRMSFDTKTGQTFYAGYPLEEILPLIVKQTADRVAKESVIGELRELRKKYEEYSWHHGDPFGLIDERIQALSEEGK